MSAARIAETPFAVAVEIVLTDVERMIAHLRDSLKAGRSAEVADLAEGHPRRRARAAHRDRSLRRLALGAPARRRRAPRSPSCCRPRSTICPVRCAACCARVPPRRSAPMRRSMRRRRRDRGASSCSPPPAATTRANLRSARRRGASIPSCRTISTPGRRCCSTGCAPRRRPSARSASRRSMPRCRFCAKMFGADYASTARQGRRRRRQGRAEGREGAEAASALRRDADRARRCCPPSPASAGTRSRAACRICLRRRSRHSAV